MKQLITAMVILAAGAAAPARPASRPGENLARGKPCRLKPRPNYRHCTDPGDATQLTDGVYAKGYFWTQKETVGWSRANPATITIDLGRIEPIRGVSFNTAAGVAGVTWPLSILVLLSDDGRTYRLAGDLVGPDRENDAPPSKGYAVHRYRSDTLAARGRYVRLMIIPSGPYTFVDEIAVYRGPDALLEKPPAGRAITDVEQFFAEICVTRGIRRRLRNDAATVRDMLKTIPDAAPWKKRLAAVEAAADALTVAPRPGFRTVFPVNDLHRRIFAAAAAAWRATGVRPVTAWQKPRWDPVDPFATPRGTAAVDVAMMLNEFRSGAFLLSNAGENTADLRVSLRGLPGGPDPAYVTVHEGVFTDTKTGVPVLAALPRARRDESGYVFTLAPGTTRRVWMTFNPRTVAPGEYRGTVAIRPARIAVPLRLKIHPLTFPGRPTLHLGGWDYTDRDACYQITPANRAAVIAHLRARFVDTPWARRNVLPLGAYDETGAMIREPDTAAFETWRRRWPGARNYCVFMSFGDRFGRFAAGTPPFKKAVAAWITWWVGRLKTWDIAPGQLGLLLVDEPHDMAESRRIIEYARVIQAAAPDVVVWEDVTWREPWKAPAELFAVCDILCPNLPMWIGQGTPFADFYVRQRKAGRTLWFYSCSGPGKLLDPYAYHRMQHWFCWRYGARGSCFWAFGDSNGASSWNEYLSGRGAYTPLFLDEDSVTAGVHMEAIREGMEDYEYLRMLRDRVAALRKAGKTGARIDAARRLVATAADRVTGPLTDPATIKWGTPKDRTVADAVRIEILDMLTQLQAQ